MSGWEEQPELLAIKEKWLAKVEQGIFGIPKYKKIASDNFFVPRTLINNPTAHWDLGLDEIRHFVAHPITVLTSKVYPLMNDDNWDPVQHRHYILDQLKPKYKSDNYSEKITGLYHKIEFCN